MQTLIAHIIVIILNSHLSSVGPSLDKDILAGKPHEFSENDEERTIIFGEISFSEVAE